MCGLPGLDQFVAKELAELLSYAVVWVDIAQFLAVSMVGGRL